MRDRLQALGQFVGSDADGTRFDALMAQSFDPEEIEQRYHWRRAFLGRYCHQPWSVLDHTLIGDSEKAVHETIALVKSEGIEREESK